MTSTNFICRSRHRRIGFQLTQRPPRVAHVLLQRAGNLRGHHLLHAPFHRRAAAPAHPVLLRAGG